MAEKWETREIPCVCQRGNRATRRGSCPWCDGKRVIVKSVLAEESDAS